MTGAKKRLIEEVTAVLMLTNKKLIRTRRELFGIAHNIKRLLKERM